MKRPIPKMPWKHPLSRIIAALGLLVTSPAMLASAPVIKLSSRGPVIFRTQRVGVNGVCFTMFKFRTMHQVSDTSAARITASDDTRIFPAGRMLRRLKADEIPQLVNVLRGDMALVGPRPEDPSIVAEHYTSLMRQTLAVLPGLTSPGSLKYYAEESQLPRDVGEAEAIYLSESLPRKIALDLVYIRNRSWRYDLEVVLRTVLLLVGMPGMFRRREEWERGEAEQLQGASDSESSTTHSVVH